MGLTGVQTSLIQFAETRARVEDAFRAVLQECARGRERLEFRFYPYTTLKITAHRKDDDVYVGVSDILEDTPMDVALHMARYILYPLYRRRAPSESARVYRKYTSTPDMEDRTARIRRERTRRTLTGPRGRHHDLAERFGYLNERFFENAIREPTLTWSAKRARRTIGEYDEHLDTITISRVLDKAPEYVLDYVLHHEMLHVAMPGTRKPGTMRRCVHSADFRRREQAFPRAADAEKWISRNV